MPAVPHAGRLEDEVRSAHAEARQLRESHTRHEVEWFLRILICRILVSELCCALCGSSDHCHSPEGQPERTCSRARRRPAQVWLSECWWSLLTTSLPAGCRAPASGVQGTVLAAAGRSGHLPQSGRRVAGPDEGELLVGAGLFITLSKPDDPGALLIWHGAVNQPKCWRALSLQAQSLSHALAPGRLDTQHAAVPRVGR